MMSRRLLAIVMISAVLAVPAFAATTPQLRIFNGTWTCPVRGGANLKAAAAGHDAVILKHCLRLTDGTYVNFLETPRSKDLIEGGGRKDMPLEVCGLYDPHTRTVDVLAYKIDGVWSTWSDSEQRMIERASLGDQATDVKGSAAR